MNCPSPSSSDSRLGRRHAAHARRPCTICSPPPPQQPGPIPLLSPSDGAANPSFGAACGDNGEQEEINVCHHHRRLAGTVDRWFEMMHDEAARATMVNITSIIREQADGIKKSH